MLHDAVEHSRQLDSQCFDYPEETAYDIFVAALKAISKRDPQEDVCGKKAPQICAVKCTGCIARTALAETGEL